MKYPEVKTLDSTIVNEDCDADKKVCDISNGYSKRFTNDVSEEYRKQVVQIIFKIVFINDITTTRNATKDKDKIIIFKAALGKTLSTLYIRMEQDENFYNNRSICDVSTYYEATRLIDILSTNYYWKNRTV